MSTITRTATLESSTSNAGIVSLVAPATYAYILTPTDPEISFQAGSKGGPDITKFAWFQFNFNDLGDSDYDNAYIASNINAVSVADFRYDLNLVSGALTPNAFVSTPDLPNSAISIPSAITAYANILAGTAYAAITRTTGAQTTDLNTDGSSPVFADIKTAIQNIENDHNSATSDNGKWAFGGNVSSVSTTAIRFDRDDSTLTNGFFLDITYTVTIAAPTINVTYSGDQATISLTSDLLDSSQTEWEFTSTTQKFSVMTSNGVSITSSNIQINASTLGSITITPQPVIDYVVRARQFIGGAWHDWSSILTVSFQLKPFNDIISNASLVNYASKIGEIARAGNNTAKSIMSGISTVTSVDVSTVDFFENAPQNISSLRNAFQEAHTQLFTSAQSVEPMRSSFNELYENIDKFTGLTIDTHLTNNGLKIDSTFAAVSSQLGQPISATNIKQSTMNINKQHGFFLLLRETSTDAEVVSLLQSLNLTLCMVKHSDWYNTGDFTIKPSGRSLIESLIAGGITPIGHVVTPDFVNLTETLASHAESLGLKGLYFDSAETVPEPDRSAFITTMKAILPNITYWQSSLFGDFTFDTRSGQTDLWEDAANVWPGPFPDPTNLLARRQSITAFINGLIASLPTLNSKNIVAGAGWFGPKVHVTTGPGPTFFDRDVTLAEWQLHNDTVKQHPVYMMIRSTWSDWINLANRDAIEAGIRDAIANANISL